MQYSFVAAGALLLATVAAQPHGHYNRHARRDAVVTNVVDVYETVMLTATVWVDEQGNTISAPVTGTAASTVTGEPQTTVKPGEFNEPTSTQAAAPVEPTPTPSSEAAPVAPTPTPSSEAAPSAPETTTIQVASVTPPAPVVPVAPTSAAEPVASSPAAVAAPAASSSPATGSSSGECDPGSPCSGDITFYEAGLGACGLTSDGSSENVVALPHEFMGTQSNGNPFCGRTVTIEYGGKTVEATVVDKCMGCVGRDLDLSNAAFGGLGIAESVGRTTANWYFN